jgi:hypothetical protein
VKRPKLPTQRDTQRLFGRSGTIGLDSQFNPSSFGEPTVNAAVHVRRATRRIREHSDRTRHRVPPCARTDVMKKRTRRFG